MTIKFSNDDLIRLQVATKMLAESNIIDDASKEVLYSLSEKCRLIREGVNNEKG
jgi:hypothetical protein